jgi:magnesium-transporting ATPase (P-type)
MKPCISELKKKDILSLFVGLLGKPEDMEARRLHFGTNDMPTLKSMSFLTLMANALCDFVVLFLLFAALASLILFVVIAILPDKPEDHYYNYRIGE